MAITKIHAIKSTLGKALAYIENPDKTDGQMLVSGYNCEPQTASIDFEMTAVLAHKARNLKRNGTLFQTYGARCTAGSKGTRHILAPLRRCRQCRSGTASLSEQAQSIQSIC